MNKKNQGSGYLPKILCIALILVVGLLCISSAQGSIGDLLTAGSTDAQATLPVNIPTARPTLTPTPATPTASNSQSGSIPTPSPTATSGTVLGQLVHNGTAEEIAHHTDSELEFIITRVTRENLVYYAVEIALTSPYQLLTAFAGNRITNRDYTSNIAESNNAILAINGDFCGYNSNGIIIRNGILYRDTASSRTMLIYDGNGNFHLCPKKALADRLCWMRERSTPSPSALCWWKTDSLPATKLLKLISFPTACASPELPLASWGLCIISFS